MTCANLYKPCKDLQRVDRARNFVLELAEKSPLLI